MTPGDGTAAAGGPAPRRLAAPAALLLWCAAVWWISSLEDPSSDLGVTWEVPDKWVHLAEFAVGGFLAREAFVGARRFSPWSAAVVFCAAWGVLDEIHQGFVPGRSIETLDAIADVAGAALGAALHARAAPVGLVRPSR